MPGIKRISTPYSYSSAVQAGDFVFIALHRGFGDNFAAQLRDTLQHLRGTLDQFELPLAKVVKINVWLKNIKDLPEMEKIVGEYFAEGGFPARMTATTEFIDEDCLLMIDGVAYLKR